MRNLKFRVWNDTENKMLYFNGIFNEAPNLINNKIKVMQFTELKDSFQEEIYEGDILSGIGKVYYDNEKGFWTTDSGGLYYALKRVHSVILGNIFEDSNLYKELE